MSFSDIALITKFGVPLVLLAVCQYFICAKAKNESYRKLLLFVPFIFFVWAMVVYGTGSGQFIDLSGLGAVLLIIYGLLTLAAVLAGWIIYILKHPNKIPDNCPMNTINPSDENSPE